MQNALSLLKTAIAENDIPDRTGNIVKACKLITDLLPFADENHNGAIFLEPELVKYLMLSVPLNSRSIGWLVSSMIDKFKHNKLFLKHLWIGFAAIAFLDEKESKEPKKVNTGLRRFQMEVRKVISLTKSSVSDDGVFDSQIFQNQTFCDAIKENKEMIKLSCLKHVKKFINVYFKELKSVLNFKPDFAELLKKFLVNTFNGKVIIKTVKVLEKLRQEDPFSCDIEIEDILLSKKSCIFEEGPKPVETPQTQQPMLSRSNTIKPQGNRSVLTRMATLGDANLVSSRIFAKRSNSLLMDILEERPHKVAPVLPDTEEMKRIEEWLAAGDIGQPALVGNKQDLQGYISNPDNYECLLAFIFDSDAQPLAHCWKENHPSLEVPTDHEEKNSEVSHHTSLSKSTALTDSAWYVLRSYKTMQALCDERNYRVFFDYNKEALESYFYNVYNTLSIRRDSLCNYNHVGMLTESLLRRDSDLCTGFILHYNLLYKFMQNIEVQYIQHLLLTLFKSSENSKDMDPEAYFKLLRYCESSSFFADISLAILRGWNSFETAKFNVDYKPPGAEDLVSIALEGSAQKFHPETMAVSSLNEIKDSLLIEELSNFQIDIDNLQPFFESDRQINKEELLLNRTPSAQKSKQKRYSNYPSLNQSIRGSVPTSEAKGSDNNSENNDDSILNTQSIKNIADLHISARQSQHSRVSVTSQRNSVRGSGNKKDAVNSEKSTRQELMSRESGKSKTTIVRKLEFNSTKVSELKPPAVSTARVNITADGILKKNGRFTVNSLNAIPQEGTNETGQAPKTVKSLNYLGVYRRSGNKKRVPKPERGSVHRDMDEDVLDRGKIEELDRLYPTPMKAKSAAEEEAGSKEYSVGSLRENDGFSLAVCEFLEILFRNAISKAYHVEDLERRLESGLGTNLLNQQSVYRMKKKYERNRDIGVPGMDFGHFWQVVFGRDCALFENLLKNYLFKIKLHHLQENNSGFAAGVLVNLILEECIKGNPDFEPYIEEIQSITKKYIQLLCKTIVQSHAWIQSENSKVFLQDFEVKNPLGAGRIQLVQTLKLFIELDDINSYQISNKVSDTCWHVLMLWFMNNKTNNMYQQMFYTIFEIVFFHCDENLLTDILFKLGFVSNLYKVWSEIFQNNMLRKDNHIDSVLYHLKKIVYLIDFTEQENESYKVLKRELKRSLGWEILKNGLIQATGNQGCGSKSGSDTKNRTTFSTSFNNRRRKNDQVLNESIPSKSEFGDGIQEDGESVCSLRFGDKMNPSLRDLETELC